MSDTFFQKRAQIVSGSTQPSVGEIRAGETEYKKDHPEYSPLGPLELEGTTSDGLSGFWLMTLKKNTALSFLIEKKDEAALMHLTDISFDYLQGPENGFKQVFTFSKNDFFNNNHLIKIYYYKVLLHLEPLLKIWLTSCFLLKDRASGLINHTIGCEIMWKDGKDLTRETKRQTRKNGSMSELDVTYISMLTGIAGVTYSVVREKSFFDFFSPPMPPTEDDIKYGRMDENKFVAIEDRLEVDYQIAGDMVQKVSVITRLYFRNVYSIFLSR